MKELLVICEELPPPDSIHAIVANVERVELMLAHGGAALERLKSVNADAAFLLIHRMTPEWDLILKRLMERGICPCIFNIGSRRRATVRPQLHAIQ
jgi:hypothetical protein